MLMNDGRQEEIGGRIVLVLSGLLCWTEPEVFPDQLRIWKIGPNKRCPSARSDFRKNRSVKGIRKKVSQDYMSSALKYGLAISNTLR